MFGGHQSKEFYQGMMRYFQGAAIALGDLSYTNLAESAISVGCAVAHGLLYDNFGARKKTVSHSLLDDNMSGDAIIHKAVQTAISPVVEKKIKTIYGGAQPIQFYEGMFRAAILVFTTAYKSNNVDPIVLDNLKWNYALIGRIISKKRRQN
ncbi:MAG: hypothetical protein AABY40_00735, partial [Nanoarchaeota archaeon]